MPEANGDLTPKEREQALAYIQSKIPHFTCSLCSGREFEIATQIVQVSPYTPSMMRLGGPVYPALLLLCRTCGQLIFISAIVAGILASDPVEEEGDVHA